MLRQAEPEKTILATQALNEAAFTAAASDVITSAAHGLSNGDVIMVTTSAGDLPLNMAVNTYYHVIDADTNTFKVSVTKGGTALDIGDAGSGTHTWHQNYVHAINVQDYRFVTFSLNTSGSCDVHVEVLGAISDSAPTFTDAPSATNRISYIDIKDVINQTSIDGAASMIDTAGTDVDNIYQANTDGLTWLAIRTRQHTVGTLTMYAKVFG